MSSPQLCSRRGEASSRSDPEQGRDRRSFSTVFMKGSHMCRRNLPSNIMTPQLLDFSHSNQATSHRARRRPRRQCTRHGTDQRVHRNPVTFVTPTLIVTAALGASHKIDLARTGGERKSEFVAGVDRTWHGRNRTTKDTRRKETREMPKHTTGTRKESTGRILAVRIGKFRKFFRANRLGPFQKTKEK